MKLEILQENLNHTLASLSRVIATKPQLPILSNILLVAKNGKLTLTASNLETSIIVETGAKILVGGDFTVPGRTLTEIIASLSAEKVLLEVIGGSLKINSVGFNSKINGIASTEYPQLSADTILAQGNYWEIDKLLLLVSLGMTTFAAAGDESRAVLSGVLFKPQEKGLTLVSTDGFRMSIVELDKIVTNKKEGGEAIIIPARSLAEITRILAEKGADQEDKSVKIYISSKENQICFNLGATKILSRLIAGNYPDYEKIVPSNSKFKIITTAEELIKSIRLASIFARDSANIVKLHIAHSKLHVSAAAAQIGENESEIDVSVEGEKSEDFSIAFNYRYFLDLLSVVTGQVVMEFSSPTSPGLFRSSSSKNFFHIIMPVRVQN